MRDSQSSSELLARLEGRGSLKNLEPYLFAEEGSPVHGDVIEFHGPEGTGKTEMLYHLIVRCIIPKSGGGLEVEVMFIDTDYHFDMLRLVTILENRLAQRTEEMIKQCLGRLFLVNCSSSTQLLLTLYSLENMFCTHPSLCLLILDSISAFYWIDRSNGGESVNLQEMNLKKCANFLEKLVREHHLALFATTQTLMQKSTSSAESFFPLKLQHETDADYRPYLCKSWQQMTEVTAQSPAHCLTWHDLAAAARFPREEARFGVWKRQKIKVLVWKAHLQLYFYWRLMQKGKRQYHFDGCWT
ncbi:DNA repair protein XRCC2 isoform X2 [Falco rusticolus]|uniref:DNA repair protein XRCC2 isoform X2 n=1 Tax=Falco rusticolus TaxID=120794 RepID=UPI000FFB0C32|nr:DNA repair protein XRCC2 isoform X2 [Falco rusticolus]